MATIIDGKAFALKCKEVLKGKIVSFKEETNVTPHLAVILVGDDPASATYVKAKVKACKLVGIESTVVMMEQDSTQEDVLSKINSLNNDNDVHGILVQLPLPTQIDTPTIVNSISLIKDVDGFHKDNTALMASGKPNMEPCTPKGIMSLLKEYNITVEGKNATVVGKSNLVGKPMAQLLKAAGANVSTVDSKTKNPKDIFRSADILVVAVGKEKLITADCVKEGAVVIDVGINRNADGKLCGDVDYDNVKDIASYITPVPGGVGPMTITELLYNTLKCAKDSVNK